MPDKARIFSIAPVVLLFCLGFSGGGCHITVVGSDSVLAITVTPANPTIAVGRAQQFTATVQFRDGLTQNRTGTVDWSSSAPAVATIDFNGRAQGVAPGKVTITAALGGVSGSTLLTVTSMAPAITVAGGPANLVITLRQTAQTFGYAAGAGEDRVDIFALDPTTGRLALRDSLHLAQGSMPVGLAIHPSGRFLYVAERGASSVSALEIDPWTGELAETPGSPFPVSGNFGAIELDAAGRLLSLKNPGSKEVSRYRVDPASGALTPASD